MDTDTADKPDNLMKIDEAAEYLGVTTSRLYQLKADAAANGLPFRKLGTGRTAGLRFSRSDLDEWTTAAAS